MDDITTKEVKFINDPKSLSALQKIHEMSNKAKERKARKSPTHVRHINENLRMDQNQEEGKFARRKSHFSTMVYPGFNLLKSNDLFKPEGQRKSYINNKEKNQKGYKSEFTWDKKNNKLVEKKIPLEAGLGKIEEKEEKEPEGKDNNIAGTKNTKIYKKVVKDENGSKITIKKVVEEISEGNNNDKLVFDEDSDDEEIGKEDMKYHVIKEKYDPQGNKIYSKEIMTNELPKGK